MDQSTSQTSAAQRPGHRDMMFCHECADEWYRDQHGLTCPECSSDFTEIIEENHDPRDMARMAGDDDGDDSGSMPDLEEAPPYPDQHQHDNPWNDDPDEADIGNFHFSQTAPGRFNVQATVTRSVSPQGIGRIGPIGGFMQMLNNLAQVSGQQQAQQQNQGRGRGEGLFSAQTDGQGHSAYEEARSQNEEGQGPGRRFTYHSGTRLYPRDANNPGPRIEPVDDIHNVMAGFFAAFGAPPGSLDAHMQPGGHQHRHEPNPHIAGNPLLQLLSGVGLVPGGGHMGDFVYSQEGLDRIVSQLMEQTATSNAPGPAPQQAIDSLTRKHVTEEMLGDEHRAECSICMDEVNIGEEVTELPCKHWFHHQCVAAWLNEHDTCPHCRKSTTKHEEEQNNAPGSSSAQVPPSDPTRHMPGAFDAPNSATTGESSDNPNDSGGFGDRVRRGLFGPGS